MSLDQAAALARSCLPSSLRGLHAALSTTAAALLASAGSGGTATPAVAAALEQLWWLLRVSAAVAADDAAGETPLIPVEVEMLCDANDPAAELLPQIGKIIGEVCTHVNACGSCTATTFPEPHIHKVVTPACPWVLCHGDHALDVRTAALLMRCSCAAH